MGQRHELEMLRRSVAMLTPGPQVLSREDALRLLTELGEVASPGWERAAPAR